MTIAQADLQDPDTAPGMIDEVLRKGYVESRPVYIRMPTDTVTAAVPADTLKHPIGVSPLQTDAAAEELAVQVFLDKLYAAHRPVFLIDGACQRRRECSILKIRYELY